MTKPKDKGPVIHIEITEAGVTRVLVYSDDAGGQAAAHMLLARIQREILQLDKALKATTETIVEPDAEVRHGHQKIQ